MIATNNRKITKMFTVFVFVAQYQMTRGPVPDQGKGGVGHHRSLGSTGALLLAANCWRSTGDYRGRRFEICMGRGFSRRLKPSGTLLSEAAQTNNDAIAGELRRRRRDPLPLPARFSQLAKHTLTFAGELGADL